MRKDFGNKGTVVTPLPVLIIGTYDENGKPDAMNVAWGGQCSDSHVAINIGHVRKTRDNITLKKAFTVSFADRRNVVAADYVGIVSGLKEPDKVAKAGWHVTKSRFVDAPVIEELPLTLECRLSEMTETETGEIRITGEVVNMSADEAILDERGRIDLGKLQPVMFDSAGLAYRVIGEKVGNAFKDGMQLK